MVLRVFENNETLGKAAAEQAAAAIRAAIAEKGCAGVVAATGASQFEFLEALIKASTIDWSKVELFHLDEYLGLPMTHPASFSRYLQERLIGPAGITNHHLMNGADDMNRVVSETTEAIQKAVIDVAFVGIGENGHLAFNDPPANFETEEPYILVELDEACRRQQVGEGWFAKLEDVPMRAISMSVRQILKAREIIAAVPEARKAAAVRESLEGAITQSVPASILRTHPNTTIYLDTASAALLKPATLSIFGATV